MPLLLVAIAQLFLAYGVFDASWLSGFLIEYPLFANPLKPSVFYPSATTSFCNEGNPGCTHQPTINVITTVVGLLLLTLNAQYDDHETIECPYPLQMIWQGNACPEPQGVAPVPAWARSLPWRTFSAAVVLGVRSVRLYLVPVLVLGGTAVALEASPNAQQIVFNALAAAFIFELDNQIAEWLFPRHIIKRYLATPSVHVAFQTDDQRAVRRWWRFKSVYCWALWFVNFIGAFLFYCFFAANTEIFWVRPFSNWYFLIQLWLHLRAAVDAVAQVWLQLNDKDLLPTCTTGLERGMRCVILAVLPFGLSFFAFQVIFRSFLDVPLGAASRFYPLEGSEIYQCLTGDPNAQNCDSFSLKMFPANVTSLAATYTYSSWYGAG